MDSLGALEGISLAKNNICERGHVWLWGWTIDITLQSNGMRIAEWCAIRATSREWSEYRHVYSSFHLCRNTSHDQFTWLVIFLKLKCTITQSNGSQFKQIYSSFSLQPIHSQIQHENTHGMHNHQTKVTSNWSCLFIIPFIENHSSIPMKPDRNCNSIHSVLPFQSLPKKVDSQSHTRNNQRRNHSRSSILSVSHNSSNRNNHFHY